MTYYRDINMELTMAQDGDIEYDDDIEAIENSIKNISKTLQNSRRMLPNFAFNAYYLLFEPLSSDTANGLANAIWDVIEEWEPRVVLDNINVKLDYNHNAYQVSISYYINNITKDTQTTTVIIETL